MGMRPFAWSRSAPLSGRTTVRGVSRLLAVAVCGGRVMLRGMIVVEPGLRLPGPRQSRLMGW